MQWGGCRGWEHSVVLTDRRGCRCVVGGQRGGACGQGSRLCFPLTKLRALPCRLAPVGPFASHSRCTEMVSITSAYSYPATKQNKIALCCCLFKGTARFSLELGWFGGWGQVLLPFLVIYLFKRKKKKTGRQLLQMYNPVDSVKQSLCCKHKPSQFRSGIDGDES